MYMSTHTCWLFIYSFPVCFTFCSGESGSGKTEISNLVIRHLMRLGANKKRSKVQNHIIHGHQVLQAFGCAKTSFNDTAASRYGVYMETHYNERGKMVGAKTLHYFLETSRLCQGKLGEGNFNVFYWLLAGTEPDEKQVLQLKDDPKAYHYLASYGRMLQSSDADEYNQLKGVMRAAGFRGEHFNRIIQLLAAILHLGNIAFTDAAAATDASATIKNRDTLECVAEMLGLDARALETVLCFRTTMIGKDVTTLILKADQAAAQRDELAQTLYSLLFSWLVEHTNQKTYTDQFNSFIGMLDFPGTQPSGFGSVGFEQFCIDYANERIYNFIMHRTFESDDAEFQAEAIQVPAVAADFTNNTACIDLYEKPTRGINAILNKMSEKTISGKRLFTDANAMEAIAKYNSDNPSFASKLSDTNARQFAIQHYAGQVTYEPTGFIAKNNNQLQVDMIALIRGNADMPASWNSFVLDLFSDENLAIDSHPLGGMSALVAAQQSAKPTRLPSMRKSQRRANQEKQDASAAAVDTSGKKTVLAQVQSAMDDLASSFQETTMWCIYCIRPNATASTTQFDSLLVQSQVEAFHLDKIAAQMQYFYMISVPHASFLSRYAVPLSNMGLNHSGSPQEQCASVKEMHHWTDRDMAIGTSKVSACKCVG